MGAAGLEAVDGNAAASKKTAGLLLPSPETESRTASSSKGVAGDLPDLGGRNPEPLTIEVLRVKLDAAIDAEAWPAVKAIRERMAEVEHEAALSNPKVRFIDSARARK